MQRMLNLCTVLIWHWLNGHKMNEVTGQRMGPLPFMKVADYIRKAVDFFYFRPFRFIPLVTFRYAAVGGLNLLYGIVQYWFIYNFILFQKDVDFGIVVISAPIFTFLINFVITFLTGFWLMKYVTFHHSCLSGYRQIIRYSVVVAINVFVNYFGLKLLISLGVYPSIANVLIQPVAVTISYFLNSRFSFR